jgi:hypothetical protein
LLTTHESKLGEKERKKEDPGLSFD